MYQIKVIKSTLEFLCYSITRGSLLVPNSGFTVENVIFSRDPLVCVANVGVHREQGHGIACVREEQTRSTHAAFPAPGTAVRVHVQMSEVRHFPPQVRNQSSSEAGQLSVRSRQEYMGHKLLDLESRQTSHSFQDHIRQLHSGVHELRGDVELRAEFDPLLG